MRPHTYSTLSPHPTPGRARGADQAEIEAAIEAAIVEKDQAIQDLTSELTSAEAANETLREENETLREELKAANAALEAAAAAPGAGRRSRR